MSAVATIEAPTGESAWTRLPRVESIGHQTSEERSLNYSQLHQLLLGQRYAQYELSDGSTVRIMDDGEHRISVKLLPPDSERSFGATETACRSLLHCAVNGTPVLENSQDETAENLHCDLGKIQLCQSLVRQLNSQPVILNVSTHGDLRTFESFEARTDSGGQITYAISAAEAFARRGYTPITVNQGWSAKDGEQAIHEGVIVSERGIILYAKADPALSDMRRKEEFSTNYCQGLARNAVQLLDTLNANKKVQLIWGHYVDGGVVSRLIHESLSQKIQSESNYDGAAPPKVAYTDHSNGCQRILDRGYYVGALWRMVSECQLLRDSAISYLSASEQLGKSAQRFYSKNSFEPHFESSHLNWAVSVFKTFRAFSTSGEDYLVAAKSPDGNLPSAIRAADIAYKAARKEYEEKIGDGAGFSKALQNFTADLSNVIECLSEQKIDQEKLSGALLKIAEKEHGEYKSFIHSLRDAFWRVIPAIAADTINATMVVPSAIDDKNFRPRNSKEVIPCALKKAIPVLNQVENGSRSLVLFAGRTDPAKNVHGVGKVASGYGQLVNSSQQGVAAFVLNITPPNEGADPKATEYYNVCIDGVARANSESVPDLVSHHPSFGQAELAKLMRFASVGLQLQTNEPFGMVAQQFALSEVPLIATNVSEAARIALGNEKEGGLVALNLSEEIKESEWFNKALDLESQGLLKVMEGGILVGGDYNPKATDWSAERWHQEVEEAASVAVALLTYNTADELRKEMGEAARANTLESSRTWDRQSGDILQAQGLPKNAKAANLANN